MMPTRSDTESVSSLKPHSPAVLAVAALVMSLAVLIPQTIVRAAIVLPLALLLPGFAILLLAFGVNRRFDWVPALALSALLSCAYYPLAGLLLAATSVAPSALSAIGAVDVLVAVVILVAYAGPKRQDSTSRFYWLPAEPPHDSQPGMGVGARGMVALTVGTLILAGVALGVAVHLEPKATPAPFTQFFLAGSSSHLSGPVRAPSGATVDVSLGVTNGTRRWQAYEIQPTVDGRVNWPVRTIVVPPAGTWTGSVHGTMPTMPGLHELILTLRRKPQAEAFESLTMWLRRTGSHRSGGSQ